MDEDLLNERGQEPLADIISTIRALYHADFLSRADDEASETILDHGLTAAVSFLHSRGELVLHNYFCVAETVERYRRAVRFRYRW